jgi:hypothetical protein
MSGGRYDYSFHQVDEMASELEHSTDIVRRAFAAHLRMVAKAMHDVEWVDSCDYSPGDDHAAIRAVIEQENVDTAARSLVVSTAYSILSAYGIDPKVSD